MSADTILNTVGQFGSIISILGSAGIGGLIWKMSANETNRKRDITELKEKLGAIETVVNKDGIVKTISEMQTNCARTMTSVEETLKAHISLPSHKGMSEKVAALGARVTNLEKKEDRSEG